jgi:alpha-glucuronidase
MNAERSRGVGGLSASLLFALLFLASASAKAEDGYRLWLRYDALPERALRLYRPLVNSIVVQGKSATLDAARAELVEGCTGLLGRSIPSTDRIERDGALVVGTPKSSVLVAKLGWARQLDALGPEGFRIRSVRVGGRAVTVIASVGEAGALYGAFHLLRLMQTLRPLSNLDVSERPRLQLRVLNHWDNLDGTIERGYAGRSLWDWDSLPDKVDPRLRDYARADASVGINGSVLNNVNASSQSLSAEYLRKTAAIADAFRPYRRRVYLTARFSAP